MSQFPEVRLPIPCCCLDTGLIGICRLVYLAGLANSDNEARRQVQGGAVFLLRPGWPPLRFTDDKDFVMLTAPLGLRVGHKQVTVYPATGA